MIIKAKSRLVASGKSKQKCKLHNEPKYKMEMAFRPSTHQIVDTIVLLFVCLIFCACIYLATKSKL